MEVPFNSGCVYVVFRIGYFTKVVFPIPITLLILANLAPRRALNRLSVRNTYLLFFIFERGDWVVSKVYFFFFSFAKFRDP